jgi:prephenate dehydrogenase
MSPLTTFSKVEIHGSGLIGTSIGLALAANGVEVRMVDSDSRAQGLAQELVGPILSKPFLADLVISAVPISAFRSVIVALEGANFTGGFIDVASVKAKPKVEVTTSRLQPSRFLPTHPMAGREVGGAESARSDLFEGRTWIIDSQEVDGDVLAMGRELISTLGADSIDLPSDEHDKAVALISHLPQIIASILAKQLGGKPESWLTLAGSGLRDTTRIAASIQSSGEKLSRLTLRQLSLSCEASPRIYLLYLIIFQMRARLRRLLQMVSKDVLRSLESMAAKYVNTHIFQS